MFYCVFIMYFILCFENTFGATNDVHVALYITTSNTAILLTYPLQYYSRILHIVYYTEPITNAFKT